MLMPMSRYRWAASRIAGKSTQGKQIRGFEQFAGAYICFPKSVWICRDQPLSARSLWSPGCCAAWGPGAPGVVAACERIRCTWLCPDKFWWSCFRSTWICTGFQQLLTHPNWAIEVHAGGNFPCWTHSPDGLAHITAHQRAFQVIWTSNPEIGSMISCLGFAGFVCSNNNP